MSPLMVVTETQNTRHEYQDCDEFAHRVTIIESIRALGNFLQWVFRLEMIPKRIHRGKVSTSSRSRSLADCKIGTPSPTNKISKSSTSN